MLKIGENLKKIRKSKGLSQQDLAKLTNIDQRIISRYELDINKPELENLIKIAIVLDISIDDLIDFKNIQHKLSKEYKEIK